MRFRAILVSEDATAVQLMTRVLRDLRVEVEHCPDVADALCQLSRGQVDAIITDTDHPEDSKLLLETAKSLPSCKRALGIVLSRSRVGQNPPAGAHIVLYKPISVERVVHGLRAIRNLMARERRTGSKRLPVEIPASVKSDRMGTTEVLIVDLSEGGAAIQAEQPVPPAGLLTIECLLPDTSAVMSATAEVVWQDAKKQFGVRFLDVPAGSRTTLNNWLRGNAHLSRKDARGRAAGR